MPRSCRVCTIKKNEKNSNWFHLFLILKFQLIRPLWSRENGENWRPSRFMGNPAKKKKQNKKKRRWSKFKKKTKKKDPTNNRTRSMKTLANLEPIPREKSAHLTQKKNPKNNQKKMEKNVKKNWRRGSKTRRSNGNRSLWFPIVKQQQQQSRNQ